MPKCLPKTGKDCKTCESNSCNAHLLPGALATRPRAVLPTTDCSVARYPCGQSLGQLCIEPKAHQTSGLFHENTPRIALQRGGMWQVFLCLVELPLPKSCKQASFHKSPSGQFLQFLQQLFLGFKLRIRHHRNLHSKPGG